MTRFSDSLRDDSVAIAKRNSDEQVECRHIVAALLGRSEIQNFVDSESLPEISAVLGSPGSAVISPTISDEATEFLFRCTSAETATEALADFLEIELAIRAQSNPDSDLEREDSLDSKPERTLDQALEDLDNLTGLASVKQTVASLVEIHRLNDERSKRNLPVVPIGLHLAFTGNPGTGKTTVARILADIYRGLGLLPRGHLVEVQRADLVAGYVGQTAIQVQGVVRNALGGVLFIDEAYALTSGHGNDFGSEAVATLVKEMEDHREELAVIVAGYTDEMSNFIAMNSGLRSRFQRFIEFPDYPDEDLIEIFKGLADHHGIGVPVVVEDALRSFISNSPANIRIGNGRFVRNLFEEMYARMAVRVGADGIITDDELEEFHADDVPVVEVMTQYAGFGFGRSAQA